MRSLEIDSGGTGLLAAALCLSLVLAIGLCCASCGGKAPKSVDTSSANFEVREAITAALQDDRALDENAANIIQGVKIGQEPLETALDEFVDQTKSLLSVIAPVTAPSAPADARLAKARDLAAEYLRNRVHQIELALSAKTPAELESLYNQSKPELDAVRKQIVDLLLSYDPALEKFLQ
jgi:hypothetical protein